MWPQVLCGITNQAQFRSHSLDIVLWFQHFLVQLTLLFSNIKNTGTVEFFWWVGWDNFKVLICLFDNSSTEVTHKNQVVNDTYNISANLLSLIFNFDWLFMYNITLIKQYLYQKANLETKYWYVVIRFCILSPFHSHCQWTNFNRANFRWEKIV